MLTVDVHTTSCRRRSPRAPGGTGFDGMRIERSGGEEWLTHRQGFRYPLPPVYFDLESRLRSMERRRRRRVSATVK